MKTAEPYDSRKDTIAHIERVQQLMDLMIQELMQRQIHHDQSKLEEPEKSAFDEFTPKLKDSTYGSPEYEAMRESLGQALKHHYEHNSHHPEHFPNGISGMTLIDLVEMFCDWKAATERHANGDIRKSIPINTERYCIPKELVSILHNTADAMGW